MSNPEMYTYFKLTNVSDASHRKYFNRRGAVFMCGMHACMGANIKRGDISTSKYNGYRARTLYFVIC